MAEQRPTCHYFVDEAGDGTLFNRRGRVIVGDKGCSTFFILGLLQTGSVEALSRDLEDLRRRLLNDPYFKNVPSMQPKAKKAALCFHAKDDIPEVRREVFALLSAHDFQFFAVVKNKLKVMEYVRQRRERDSCYRYHPNELYDFMARRLFKERLHKHDNYEVVYAARGKSDRTAALRKGLDQAKLRFREQWSIESSATIDLAASSPKACHGLQAVDYFLWALQRLYERREDRYVEFLWPKFKLVQDIDDTREAKYGVYYTQKKPLVAAALEDLPGI